MKPYIYTAKNGVHIIDLALTQEAIEKAYAALKEITENGGKVLFVGTKKQAQTAVLEEALRSGSFYVNQRWLGGTLTNFKTIRSRIKRMDDIDKMEADGTFDLLPKKEVIQIKKEYAKLDKNLRGIREMKRLPQALVIVDPRKEENAIKEARILGIPVFGVVDTNCDPDLVDYVIPGNDDAVRAVKLLLGVLTNAIAEVNGNDVIDYVNDDDKAKSEKKAKKEVAKEEIAEVKEVVKEEKEAVDYSSMTLADLKTMAKDAGVKGYSAMKKAELIEVLSK